MGKDLGETEMSPSTSEDEQGHEMKMYNLDVKTVESFVFSSSEEEQLPSSRRAQQRAKVGHLDCVSPEGRAGNRGQVKEAVDWKTTWQSDLVQESELKRPSMARQTTDPAMERPRKMDQRDESSKTQAALSMPMSMPTLTRQKTDPAMSRAQAMIKGSCGNPIANYNELCREHISCRTDPLEVNALTIKKQCTDSAVGLLNSSTMVYNGIQKPQSLFNAPNNSRKSGDGNVSHDPLQMPQLTKQRTDPVFPLEEMVKKLENLMEPQLRSSTSDSASHLDTHSEQFKKWLGNVETPAKNGIDLSVREDVPSGKCIDSYSCKCYVPVLEIGRKVLNEEILGSKIRRSIIQNDFISIMPGSQASSSYVGLPAAADLVEYIKQWRSKSQGLPKDSSPSEHLVQALDELRSKDKTGCGKKVVLERRASDPVRSMQFSGTGNHGFVQQAEPSRQQFSSPVQMQQDEGCLSGMFISPKNKRFKEVDQKLITRQTPEPNTSRSLHGCVIVRSDSDTSVKSRKNRRNEESLEPRFSELLPLGTWPPSPKRRLSDKRSSAGSNWTFQMSTGRWSYCNGVKFCKLLVDLKSEKNLSSYPLGLQLWAGPGLSGANIHCDTRGINPPYVLPRDLLYIRVEGVGKLKLFASPYKKRRSPESSRFSHLIDVPPEESMERVRMRDAPRIFWAYLGRRMHISLGG